MWYKLSAEKNTIKHYKCTIDQLVMIKSQTVISNIYLTDLIRFLKGTSFYRFNATTKEIGDEHVCFAFSQATIWHHG